jgi:cysteine-rich repeat protein
MKNPDALFPTIKYTALLLFIMSMAACLDSPTFMDCGEGLCPAGWYCGVQGDCQVADCGNDIREPGEVCDDGDTADGDGCSADCRSEEICGNGTPDPGEECDDGNTEDGDGCSADCRSEEICGNGTPDPGEACDDGNTEDGDGCSATCELEDGDDPPPPRIPVWRAGQGPDDVFAVGACGTLLRHDTQSGQAMESFTGESLDGVWGSGPENVFAVGDSGCCITTGSPGRPWNSPSKGCMGCGATGPRTSSRTHCEQTGALTRGTNEEM